jgi:hypothetical protein
MTTYYWTHRSWFKEYYRVYYLKHRQEQINKATAWYLASEENRAKHAKACKKYLMKNKTSVYSKRRIKSLHKILMKELIDYHIFKYI